ncbi:hypothetical protein C1645_832610 [Glomus cerebriforme]|uniref:Uncharacterized protein n=1 Tax=Glomus cerebriforme TaxID=658196 RepID=A0A397SD68_9GLOM|nr:hypothetical protein C1645_832610 [Glomus cerebriforme]
MTIFEVPSKRNARSTRIPPRKIIIQWRHESESNISSVYNKLPFSRTCSYTLIFCQDYYNFKEFAKFFKISLFNSEGFSETSYRNIRNLVNNFKVTKINPNAIGGPESNTINLIAARGSSISNNSNIEIIDLTEVEDLPNIAIDIYRETNQNIKQKKPKYHSG